MQANPSAAARSTLERVLLEMYPQARPEIEEAAGGFVVGLVSPVFKDPPLESELVRRLLQRLGQENETIERFEDRVAVFTLRFYPDEKALFTENAILRTRRDTWQENGMLVKHGSAGDAHVLAHRLDAEARLIDPNSKSSCRVIQNPEIEDYEIGHQRYVQFDLGGHPLEVDRLEQREGGIWTVHLK